MKRVYEKPEIMFEDFSLSTNIASCMYDIDDPIDQGPDLNGNMLTLFVNSPCNTSEAESFGLCYHNPSDLNNTHNS